MDQVSPDRLIAVVDSMIDSREDAANALRELFLANADRGDNAANDQLIGALVGRLRVLQAARDGASANAVNSDR